MTFWDALLAVPAGLWWVVTNLFTILSLPIFVVIYGLVLIFSLALLWLPSRGRVRTWVLWVIGIVQVWLGVALIYWGAVGSMGPFAWA